MLELLLLNPSLLFEPTSVSSSFSVIARERLVLKKTKVFRMLEAINKQVLKEDRLLVPVEWLGSIVTALFGDA